MKDLYYIKLVKEIEILFEKIKMTKANLKKENNISKLNEYKHDCYILLKKLNLAKKMAFSLNTEDYNNFNLTIKEVKKIIKDILQKIDEITKKEQLALEMKKFSNKNITLLEELKFNNENISSAKKLEMFKKLIDSNDKIDYLKYILENLKENKNYEVCKNRLFNTDNAKIIDLLKKEISYVKEKLKNIKNQNNKKVCFKKIDISLSHEQQSILKNIDEDIDYDDYSILDLIMCLAGLLASDNVNDNIDKINILCDYLTEELVEYMSYKNDYKNELFILLNCLKIRITESEKNSDERIYFKKIYKSFKDLNDIYKESNNRERMNPYFAMVMYFLKDDKNYIYIKELLKRREYVTNVRYEGKHIIFYILEEYFNNFDKMLKDKNGEYVNVNYLKEVYMLFFQSKAFKISRKEAELLNDKIKEFQIKVKKSLTKEKRKKAVEDDLNDMRNNSIYQIYGNLSYSMYHDYTKLSDDDLICEANSVVQNVKNYSNKKEATNVFVYGSAAYSLEDKNNSYVVTMYAIDYANYILPKSRLGKYLYNQELIGDKPDSFTNNYLRFRADNNYPVFAYQIEFSNTGNILGFKLYKDYVHVDEVIVGNHTNEKIEMLKKIHNIVASKNSMEILKYDLYNINSNFEALLMKEFVKFIEKEKLPYLYYGKITPDFNEAEQRIFDLSNEIFKLEKIDSHEIKHILSSQIDKNHYSTYPIPNAKYSLNLLTPFSFQGIETERMLNDLYFNERKFNDPRRLEKLKRVYKELYTKLSFIINRANNYVDPVELEKSKGKIRKIYKKI